MATSKGNKINFELNQVPNKENDTFNIELHPLPETDEYIGTIKIEENETLNSVQTVIILDRSGSMELDSENDQAKRFTNEILPLFLSNLLYEKSQPVHLLSFAKTARHELVTVEEMKSLPIKAKGNTYMEDVMENIHRLFSTHLDEKKPVRVLTITDGKDQDYRKTQEATTKLIEFLNKSHFSINSQAVRLFTSKEQPDSKALCNLLQINNTTKSELVDIDARESNGSIASALTKLFESDNFSRYKTLSTEEKILAKFPWDIPSYQIILIPGQNVFWVKKVPATAMKIGNSLVKIVEQPPLTLSNFQLVMETKLYYILGKLPILKIVGTDEALEKVNKMLKYFEKTEDKLAQLRVKSLSTKVISIAFAQINNAIAENLDSNGISKYLQDIGSANNKIIETFISTVKAEYLREITETKSSDQIHQRDIQLNIAKENNVKNVDYAERAEVREKCATKPKYLNPLDCIRNLKFDVKRLFKCIAIFTVCLTVVAVVGYSYNSFEVESDPNQLESDKSYMLKGLKSKMYGLVKSNKMYGLTDPHSNQLKYKICLPSDTDHTDLESNVYYIEYIGECI